MNFEDNDETVILFVTTSDSRNLSDNIQFMYQMYDGSP